MNLEKFVNNIYETFVTLFGQDDEQSDKGKYALRGYVHPHVKSDERLYRLNKKCDGDALNAT